ncbi:hypothetical protein N8D56_05135 [Devosia sp. A8/3-2]|nr:hypothetical protein N8D56_05135 [Devosia sp. A8/3-2]
MRRTIISAVIGAGLAFGVMTAIDGYQNIRTAARFAEMQQASPSDWLELSSIQVRNSVVPAEPSLRFVGTSSMDLLIRLAVSPREADTGNVICSGGGRTTLFEEGIPVTFDARISSLAGLDSCDFPVGRYRVRLSFLMTEPGTQISKTLLVETEDLEVIAAPVERSAGPPR